MKPLFAFVVCAVLVPAVSASEGVAWTYVPAAREVRSPGSITLPDPLSESAVILVGSDPMAAAAPSGPLRVFAVEISESHPGSASAPSSQGLAALAVPVSARWPDAQGRIAAGPSGQGIEATPAGLRNPWEIRIVQRDVEKDVEFDCGGIITGGGGGPVAILNGRIVQQGDSVGEFTVAGVLANGVLLLRSASYFVIPRGRHTTIVAAGG